MCIYLRKHDYAHWVRAPNISTINGCGSKPMLPVWGRCTTHFRTYFSGDWDVHWGCDLAFDPWPEKPPTVPARLESLYTLHSVALEHVPRHVGICFIILAQEVRSASCPLNRGSPNTSRLHSAGQTTNCWLQTDFPSAAAQKVRQLVVYHSIVPNPPPPPSHKKYKTRCRRNSGSDESMLVQSASCAKIRSIVSARCQASGLEQRTPKTGD